LESEAFVRLEIWPAWILLFCSLCLLVAAFARAFSGELRRLFFSADAETALKDDQHARFLETFDS
jgi:hypothetical protein